MTNKEVLAKLQDLIDADREMDDECRLVDILDYLSQIGIEGAREIYMAVLRRK